MVGVSSRPFLAVEAFFVGRVAPLACSGWRGDALSRFTPVIRQACSIFITRFLEQSLPSARQYDVLPIGLPQRDVSLNAAQLVFFPFDQPDCRSQWWFFGEPISQHQIPCLGPK